MSNRNNLVTVKVNAQKFMSVIEKVYFPHVTLTSPVLIQHQLFGDVNEVLNKLLKIARVYQQQKWNKNEICRGVVRHS
jgi:hypothetical protein